MGPYTQMLSLLLAGSFGQRTEEEIQEAEAEEAASMLDIEDVII